MFCQLSYVAMLQSIPITIYHIKLCTNIFPTRLHGRENANRKQTYALHHADTWYACYWYELKKPAVGQNQINKPGHVLWKGQTDASKLQMKSLMNHNWIPYIVWQVLCINMCAANWRCPSYIVILILFSKPNLSYWQALCIVISRIT